MKKMSNLSRRMKKRSAQQQSVAEVDVLAETKTRKLKESVQSPHLVEEECLEVAENP